MSFFVYRPSLNSKFFFETTVWNEHIHQYGYWFVEEFKEYIPSEELASFLNAGEKTVYIGFGSMTALGKHENLAELTAQAIIKSGKRGIICGMGKPANLPKDIIALFHPYDNLYNYFCSYRNIATTHG